MSTVRTERTINGNFPACVKAMVHYGTFSAGKVRQLEALKNEFLARSSRGTGPQLSQNQRISFTEYLLISGQLFNAPGIPENLLSPKEEFQWLIPEIHGIRHNKRFSLGLRSHGMFNPTSYGLWQKNVLDATVPLPKKNLLEIGSGYSIGSILFAENNPESFVVAVEANALNLLGAYALLEERKLIERPSPNLRLLLGDISRLRPPSDFKADLVVMQFFNVAGPTLTEEEKQICNSILQWMNRNAKIIVFPRNLKLTDELASRAVPLYD